MYHDNVIIVDELSCQTKEYKVCSTIIDNNFNACDVPHVCFLPKEILSLILISMNSIESMMMFSLTSKQFRKLFPFFIKTDEDLTIAYSRRMFNITGWYLDNNWPTSVTVMHQACYKGRYEAVVDLREKGCEWDASAVSDVILNTFMSCEDKLRTIKYMRLNGCEFSSNVFFHAVNNDYVEITRYLLSENCPFPSHELLTVVKTCQMLQLLTNNNNNAQTLHFLAQHAKTKEIFEYATSNFDVRNFFKAWGGTFVKPLEHAIKSDNQDFLMTILKHVPVERLSDFSKNALHSPKLLDILISISIERKQIDYNIAEGLTFYDKVDLWYQHILKGPERKKFISNAAKTAAKNNDITLYQWSLNNGFILNNVIFKIAVEHNSIDMMNLTYDMGQDYPIDVYVNLARQGQIHYLDLLFKNQQLLDNSAKIAISKCICRKTNWIGVKWFIDHGFWSDSIYQKLVQRGSLEILQKCKDLVGTPYPSKLIDIAVRHDRKEILRLLLKECKIDVSRVCMKVNRTLKVPITLETVKFIIVRGKTRQLHDIISVSEFTITEQLELMRKAAELDKLHLLKLMRHHGFEWDESVIQQALYYSSKDTIQWMLNSECKKCPVLCLHCRPKRLFYLRREEVDIWLCKLGLASHDIH
jgi:hypothetical protein